MTHKKKRAVLECCCGGCGGCCWEVDANDPSQAVPITFDIVAPSCVELATAGDPATFTPQESLATVEQGSCGPCTYFVWNVIGNGAPDRWSVGGEEPGDPLPSPCSWQVAAALVCTTPDTGEANAGTNVACCRNVRLLMAADNEFSGSRLLTDFTTLPALAAYAAAAQTLIDGPGTLYWGKLKEPTSCSCDASTGMHAEFDISGWVSPACSSTMPYVYECCSPTICNLAGAVLQF